MALNHAPRCWLAALLVALLSSRAEAGPGDHIRSGPLVITPSVSVGGTYHSNVYLSDGSADSPEVGAPALLVQPRIKLSLPKKDLELDWEFGYHLKKFIETAPNDVYNVQNLDRYNEVDSTLDFIALQRSVLGVRFGDVFSISNYPAELATSDTDANVIVTSNDASGGLVIRPGSALDIDVLGLLGVDNYNLPGVLQENTTSFNFNGRASYGPMLNANWRFLPKTTFISENSLIWDRWQHNLIAAIGPQTAGADYGNYIGKPNAIAWRTLWGLKGQFTNKISAQVEAGFGEAFYDEQSVLEEAGSLSENSAEVDLSQGTENFDQDLTSFKDGFLVNLQVAYVPAKSQTVTLGYRKDFQDAVFTNYVAYNYVFARYGGTFAKHFGAGAELGLRYDGYHGEVHRTDLNTAVKAELGYKFTSYLDARLSGGWTQRSCADKGCDGIFYATQYDDFWGELGLTAQY